MAASDELSSQGLSEELQEKAKTELGEKPEWRKRDIEALRDLIKSDIGVYCPHDDDAFLLMFLRARKFDYESAAKLIRRYYEVRVDYEDFYKNFRPSAVRDKYENGVFIKLPKAKETDAQPMLARLAQWDPASGTMDDLLKANLLQIEKLIRMEENQVNGVALVMDMNNLTWAHVKNMNPFVAKRTMSIVQHAMPCRMKAIHYVNVPHFFEYVFAMVKQFMSEKLRNRVHIHATPEYLTEHFHADTLPKDLGGTLDLEPLIKEWSETMIASEDEFKSREKYGIKKVDAVSGKETKSADPVGGVTGTFKKLSCD